MSEKTSTSPLSLPPELNTNKCNYFSRNMCAKEANEKPTLCESSATLHGTNPACFDSI